MSELKKQGDTLANLTGWALSFCTVLVYEFGFAGVMERIDAGRREGKSLDAVKLGFKESMNARRGPVYTGDILPTLSAPARTSEGVMRAGPFVCQSSDKDAVVLGIVGRKIIYADEGSFVASTEVI